MNERNEMTERNEAAALVARASLLAGLTKGVFFILCLLSILGFAFAVTYYDKADGKTTAVIGLLSGILLLVAAAVSAALLSRTAARARDAAAVAVNALYEGEDGLPKEFCLAIREETVENLKIILEEQGEDYTPEEYAFVAKVYEEKIG